MKRQIILRIIVCIAAVAMLFTGLFVMAACGNKTGDDGATYQLNLSEDFDGIVTYGEPMDFTGITLLRTQDGVSTVIQVDASMVTTHVDTTKIGAKLLKFNYAGQSFHVPVIVKYKIQFEVDGETLETFHVLNAGELEKVETPEKPGYVFAGWSEEIPEIITRNMTFAAVYTPEIPEVSEVDATYGDKLSNVKLPFTVVGAWQFDDAEGTVGDAGKRTFPVSFVSYETGEVLATDTVTVNVAKKEVTFSEIVDSFIYNGERQLPTYKTDAPVNVLFYEDPEANYTDVGVYGYYFEVDDPNYKGTLIGTYEIKHAVVNVKINSYTILSNEELPVVEYEVSGFDNIELIGLSITDPEDVVVGIGTYTLTATASNKNFILNVEEGTITVNSTTLQIADPTLSTGVVTYGDLISVIEFNIHPNGKWSWKDPDALVGTVGKQTHVAVFTPTDSRYDVIERAVEITVAPKELIIEIVGSTTFDYNSATEHTLSYVVKDEATGTVYDLAVLGNTPCKNAGVYEITLTLEDKNYSATKVVTLTVNKIDPVTDFEQVISATWSKTLKLSNVTLPAGYAWVDSLATEITTAGTHRFKAIYTPEDTTNYNTVSGEFEVNVAKAAASINNVSANYEFTYNGGAFLLDTVTRSHTESELVFAYQKDGKAVDSLTNAGVYTVTITLPETGNYEAAVVTTTVTIAKANNTENVILSQTATYGDLVFGKITLPAGVEGTWTIQNTNETTTVGDAGIKTFVAVYTSATGNYNEREVEITVTVAKKRVNAPAISAAYREQVFTGAILTSGLVDAEGYVVTDNGAINVGTHTVTVALVSGNYMWSDGTTEDKSLTYRIVAADNQWTTEPTIDSWVYGDAGNAGMAEALAGTVTVEYKVLGADDSTYSTTVPTNAGAYVARFTATDSNYKDLVATREFSIAKKAVTVPEISASKLAQVYTGSILTSGLTETEEYTVTDNGGANVATYTATLILRDKNNYKWATTDNSDNVSLTYEVVKAQIVISDLAINGWTFGNKANAPTATTNFGTVTYVYATAIGGEYTAVVPTNAGTYYVKAIAQGNENLIGAESEAISFTIAKAGVTINGANDTYTKVYDTKEYTVTGVTASNGEKLTVVITKNGEVVEKIIDAGTYTVTFSIEESANYLRAEKSVTVTITAATNSEVVNTNQSATYGEPISVITLPAGVQGTWSIQGVTTVGNAGTNTFTAVFTPANGNYNEREVEITVTVAKATVKVPIVDPKEYDGQHHNSGLTNTNDYTVTTDNGGVDHGTYEVVLTLTDPANYKWELSDAASFTIKYEISAAINKWAEEPTIGSWEYESAGIPGHAVALYGDVKIEYKPLDADDSAYSTTLPTLPGKYVARFTTTDDNYTILSVTKAFEITKRKITPPTQTETEFVYTGNTITSGITGNEFFEVVDNGAINVQEGLVVTVTLKSEHYVWSDGVETLAREYTYSITKAQITISDFAIAGWTFNQNANEPTVNTNFACDVSYVYADAIDGKYTATVPTEAGTYYVKAIAAGDANLIGAESAPVSFTIAKASVTINGANDTYTKVYDTEEFTITGVTASNGAELTVTVVKVAGGKAGVKMIDAGTYTVTFSLAESDNYLGAEKSVTVTITPATNTEVVNTNQSATYGDSISKIELPAGVEGAWSIKETVTTVGNAGVNKFTAVYTSTTGNYDGREVEITVTVARKEINVPAISDSKLAQTYTGATLTSGLVAGEGYTVSDNGGIDVDTYTATITLDAANYVWSDGTDGIKELTYKIVAAENYWVETPAISGSWIYGQAGDKGSATPAFGELTIEYKPLDAGDSAYSTEFPTNVGKYKARFTATDKNHIDLVDYREFEITKATVNVPEVNKDLVYNGKLQNAGIATDTRYTVTNAEQINAGSYKAILTLTDSANYKWSNSESDTIEVVYEIAKAQITISDFAIAGWTFNQNANTPTVNTNFTCDVSYVYANAIGGEYTAVVPTNAGTYYVKAIAQGNENLIGAESDAISFTIAKADVTIDVAEDTYTKVYDTEAFTITGVTASNGGELTVVITKNGSVVTNMVNAGEYTVTFKYAGDDNYNAAEKSVTVTITPATNNEVVNTNQSATYGDSISKIELPAGVEGTWSIKETVTTVGNAGVNKFTAVYTSTTGNYDGREVEITVTVARKAINVPAINDSKLAQTYTGATLTSGLVAGEGYTVSDNGGIDVGTYTATLTLDGNHVWSGGTTEDKKLTYKIVAAENHWTEQPAISGSWTYGQAGDKGSAIPEVGELTIEYKPLEADDSAYSTEFPTDAGKYMARFTATDKNYIDLVDYREFEITKAEVKVPTIGEKTYTGSTIKSGLVDTDQYTVTIDNGGVDVGTYNVTLTLTNSNNYKWETTDTAEVEVSYTIDKAKAEISDFAIEGWTFGEEAKMPTATTTFGTVYYLYAPVGGEYSETVPTNAGTYNVKAFVAGTTNFEGAESEAVTFTIAKANVTINGAEDTYTKVYDTQEFTITGVTASNGGALTVVITKNGSVVTNMVNAGEYTVTFKYAGDDNYNAAEKLVTVTITAATNTEVVNTNQSATYGDSISKIELPAGVEGAWSIEGDATTVGNAGVNTITAVFTPDSNGNYNKRTVEITVNVAKKTVATPAVPNASMVYNGQTQYSGLDDTTLYTVTDNGGVNVGTYPVTLTLVDPANYAWNTADNTSATATVSYEITATDNEISATVNDVPYGAELDMTVTVKYGGWTVAYKNAAGEFVDKPVAAGEYTAIFTTTDTNCEILTIERVFTINIAKVEPPSVSNKPYTGEKITSGLESNLLYTIVTDEGGINVGEYKVTIKLTDPNSSEWYAGGSEDIVLTYNITKIENTTIEGITAGWTYGAYVAPTVTVNPAALADKVIFWYSVDGGASWSETAPTNAGTYQIKAEIVATDNYVGFVTDAEEFTIAKATPTITTAPSFVGKQFYQNMFTPTNDGVASVAGSWTFGSATLVGGVFSDTADNAQVVATFTPNDTDNYESVTVTYSVTFVPVAYLDDTTPYGTIEDAIAAANAAVDAGAASATVWVRPYKSDLGPIFITKGFEIAKKVTLLLPHGADGKGRENISNGQIDVPLTGPALPTDAQCHVMVIVSDGVVITNKGTLEITGQLSGGSGGGAYAGQTSGLHARLFLGANAKIENYGTIYAAGYIREQSQNNGSMVVLNSGSVLYQPFTVRDYTGGSITTAMGKTMGGEEPLTAFNRFILMNVSPLVRINYGGSVRTWATLNASSTNNKTIGNFVGSDMYYSDAVIVLTDGVYSYLTAKYDVNTEICDLRVYGGAKTNPMVLKVSGMDVSTAGTLFALSYHYNITLAPNSEKGQTTTAVFELGQRFKLMTGGTLTVESGAKLVIDELIVYEEFIDSRDQTSTKYPDHPAGVLTVNGILECNSLGGKVYSKTAGATVIIKKNAQFTAYELKSTGGTLFATTVTAKQKISANAVLVGTDSQVTATASTWVVGKISLDAANGNALSDIFFFYDSANAKYPSLPTPVKENSSFQGWMYNGTLVKEGDALANTEPHTLTATWKSGVKINLDANGGTCAETSTNYDTETNVYPDLPIPELADHKFMGWYYGDTLVSKGVPVVVNGEHTLTAKWVKVYSVSIDATEAEITGVSNGDKIAAGETVTITVKFNQKNDKSLIVKDAAGNTLLNKSADGTYDFIMPEGNVTITASSAGDSCLVEGTLITMADGTQKPVEDLKVGDMVLIFNHVTGQYEAAPIIFNTHKDSEADFYDVLHLFFSNGEEIKIVASHGFFDLTLMQYVYITYDNYNDYIGHEFYFLNSDGETYEGEAITLTEAYITNEYTRIFCPVSYFHMNSFANGALNTPNIPGDITGLVNYFEYDSDLKYNEEAMARDIEEYGLYTYEDFSEYISYEAYMSSPSVYLKVAVGKGMITYEQIIDVINYLLEGSLIDADRQIETPQTN